MSKTLHPQVSVAYSGVHQAYQIALAAQEAGLLRHFYCSLYSDGIDKWGGWLRKLSGKELLSRRLHGIDGASVRENPWPLARKALTSYLYPASSEAWLSTNEAFDRWSTAQFARNPTQVLVGTETCDLFTLRLARQLGATTVHDCPQIHPHGLRTLMQEATERTGLKWQVPADDSAMEQRKLEEYELADRLLVYSEFHSRTFRDQGFSEDRIFQCPLWVDSTFWRAGEPSCSSREGRLKVLFVGSLTLRKGLPFLLDAVRRCRGAVQLTLAGPSTEETPSLIQDLPPGTNIVGPQSKSQLRECYLAHDVMVLPSVADSFGFVALEAMSCGLPVLISENCGAPAPSAWRFPAMDHHVLEGRLLELATTKPDWQELRETAVSFSRQFTPERYRSEIAVLLKQLVGPSS